MNSIEARLLPWPTDSEANYRELLIDGKSFQETIKSRYPNDFLEGRYRETFVPILSQDPAADQEKEIVRPIYGCQDGGCCLYVFARIKYDDKTVTWTGIGQNRLYLMGGEQADDGLRFLQGVEPMTFDRIAYQKVF
eukprot:CAMPEP_0194212034 /NCGR_PEP_ID=MMETSP0156-20130528/11577_1 /TAXON_ID=33649 /ORGANISM="Thalassionema nitzschioides, Strain L26-B" /LENGTH=135 /DNA_ID=CAMNT_0038939747 /DNA_START=62 /DNA_END=466 /DNA_ORIENTATION=-